jgi:hypothetical protein
MVMADHSRIVMGATRRRLPALAVALLGALALTGCSQSTERNTTTTTTKETESAETESAETTTAQAESEGPGSYSHTEDGQFCQSHTCIENFPYGHGTVVKCSDGEWSHSGGIQGACSDHGGEVNSEAGEENQSEGEEESRPEAGEEPEEEQGVH